MTAEGGRKSVSFEDNGPRNADTIKIVSEV